MFEMKRIVSQHLTYRWSSKSPERLLPSTYGIPPTHLPRIVRKELFDLNRLFDLDCFVPRLTTICAFEENSVFALWSRRVVF